MQFLNGGEILFIYCSIFLMSEYQYIMPICILMSGWLLDLLLGDPSWLPHPVVYMGKWISFGEKRLNKGNHRTLKGALFSTFSVTAVFALAYILFYFPGTLTHLSFSILSALLQAILVFFCLAGKTLRKEVKMVFTALDKSLADGRRQVARIVGRDTSDLSDQEVRTAALETLAENLSDGVIAPIFWFALLGVPGMLAYKMVNTLDSMIGYRNERYKQFGCWAAHIDDVANFIPARITAFLMVITGWATTSVVSKNTDETKAEKVKARRTLWQQILFVCHYGPKHASPNSGWPEAALAATLDCRFGGTHQYFGKDFFKPHIGNNPRELNGQDLRTSIVTCLSAEIISILLVTGILFLRVVL